MVLIQKCFVRQSRRRRYQVAQQQLNHFDAFIDLIFRQLGDINLSQIISNAGTHRSLMFLSLMLMSSFWGLARCSSCFFLIMTPLSHVQQVCSNKLHLTRYVVFSSTSLPIARTRCVPLTLSSFCTLFQAAQSIILSKIKRKIIDIAKN